jgi:seryl-tRNA synthetase
MKKEIMAETCQLADFDEQLYKVTTGVPEKPVEESKQQAEKVQQQEKQ